MYLDSNNIKEHILPKFLEQLNEDDINNIFLEMKNESDHFDGSDFLNKTKGDFINDFLIPTESLEDYPLEALIWAYAKDENSRKKDIFIMGKLYDKSREGKIVPRTSINEGNIYVSDQIIYTYFSALKEKDSRIFIENSIKQKVVFLIESKSGKVNDDAIQFLSDFYANYNIDVSYIINGIGRAVYGLIPDLKQTIKIYFNHFYQLISNITFIYKNAGAQYGIIAKTQDEKKFFVKGHQYYPYRGYGQSLTTQDSEDLDNSISVRLNSLCPIQSVDLKELFVYKTLEYTGIGPKTHFILNKKLKGGLFIGTEEINNFLTLKDIQNKKIETYLTKFSKLSNAMKDENYVVTGDGDESILVELAAFDIIVRSLLLTDLNKGNIGFASIEGKETVKIIDFMIPQENQILEQNYKFLSTIYSKEYSSKEYVNEAQNNPFIYTGIIFSFVSVEGMTEYPHFLLDDTFMPKRIKCSNLSERIKLEKQKLEKFQKLKKKFGALAINKIGEYDKLESVFLHSYEEICAFAQKNKNILFIGDEIESQITTLEKYKNASLTHLKHLYEYLDK